ncbi:MAG: UDP-N-acetylmuramate dehydrogenase [Phascolarctobacterium sp.]|nr:UDP-N-acetylmuramate dehydrogenase [Candidatus Phascolarctobacterium caballi]
MNYRNLFDKLAIKILFDEPMSKHTTFAIGGIADVFAVPSAENELLQLSNVAKQYNLPIVFLGNGSNVLVNDKGIRGLVVSMKGLEEIVVRNTTITAGAGVLLGKIANVAADNELTGLEFAAGIPGTVGGAVYMNAGAYDGQIGDIIKSVRVLQENGKIVTVTLDNLKFGYRHSILQDKKEIVVSASFDLKKDNRDNIKQKMLDFQQRRRDRQPLNYSSAGSIFKRPVGYYAAALIDECGLKGLTVGKAMVSDKHAGFIVNTGGATANDVLILIKQIQDIVFEKKGVRLETEIVVLGGKE